ncbi:MAG: hypothetical protein NTU79_00425 [Planctomycetota bacterium]|nr:hypothetical protein [Planctomycetota bacterium]
MNDKNLRIDTSEAYDLAAKGMVRSLLLLLRESLIEAKVNPRKQRQICESFCVALCDHLDQGWFRVDGQTFYPLLAFTRSFLNIGTELQEVEPVLFLEKGNMSFFEMFSQEADLLFKQTDEISIDDCVGVVGQERADCPVSIDDSLPLPQACPICAGSGKCYCIRKGTGNPVGCARCNESGECRHCKGQGKWN